MKPGTVESPCTGVCRIDPASGCCEGCLRTLDEIAAWSALDDAARRAINDALPSRRPGAWAAERITRSAGTQEIGAAKP